MELAQIWFAVLVFLFAGYFVLEGFDFGVGAWLPWLGGNDQERQQLIATIGPFWDGNEVWLITAGAVMFAAFPGFYAAIFSSLYLPFFLLLLLLILRGVAFEFRGQLSSPSWRRFWDWALFAGSAGTAFLWGIAMANWIRGIPLATGGVFVGSLLDLLSPYTFLGGLAALLLMMLQGGTFLLLRTHGQVYEKSRRATLWIGAAASAAVLIFVLASYFASDIFAGRGVNPGVIPLLAGVAMLSVRALIDGHQDRAAFAMSSLTVILSVVTVFTGMYPNLVLSSSDPTATLTISQAVAGEGSLRVLSWVGLSLLPVVLAYEAWSFWVFRERVGEGAGY